MPAAPSHPLWSWLLVVLVPAALGAAALLVRRRRRRPPSLHQSLVAGALERPRRWRR